MTLWLSIGILFVFASIAFVLYRWGNMECIGVTPVRKFTFIAILFHFRFRRWFDHVPAN